MASDIGIPIGAKNKASAILSQVGQDARKLGTDVRKLGNTSKQSTQTFNVSFKSMLKSAAGITAVIGLVKGLTASLRGLASFAGSSVAAFNVQADAERGLALALEISGEMTDAVFEKNKRFAAQLQENANIADETTLRLMKQASMLGVEEDQLDDVSAAAAGLSEALGIGLDSAMRRLIEAQGGQTSMLARYIPALRDATTESEKLAIIQDIAAKGLAQAQDRTTSLEGVMTRAKNSWGDLKEAIGAILGPIRMLIAQGWAVFAETLSSMLAPAMEQARNLMQNMGDRMAVVGTIAKTAASVIAIAWEAVRNVFGALAQTIVGLLSGMTGGVQGFQAIMQSVAIAIVRGITFIEVGLSNIPTIFGMVRDSILLRMEQIRADTLDMLVNRIPALWKFGAQAVVTIAVQMAQNVRETLGSMASSAVNIFTTMINVLKGKASLGDVKAAIAAGLQEAVSSAFDVDLPSLPEIAARELTQKEKDLAQQIAESGKKLGDEFGAKFNERLDKVKEAMGDVGKGEFDFDFNLKGKTEDAAGKDSKQDLTATVSRLLTKGPGHTIQDQILQTNRDQLVEQKEQKALTQSVIDTIADSKTEDQDTLKVVMVS